MLESFGARLRRRREEQGIALATIAADTKIKLSLFEGLERDDVSHWPSGIFRRAYIRTYAQAIGLDPDAIAREFLIAHPDPGEVVTAEAIGAVVDGARTHARPPTRLRYIVGSALGSLSRLRSSAGVEELGVTDAAPVGVATTGEPGFATVHTPPGTARAERTDTDEVPPADRAPVDAPFEAVVGGPPGVDSATADPDLMAVAALCTEFGRVGRRSDVQPLLREAAGILDATGLIVWIWDAPADGLRPALVHGYSQEVLAHVPTVSRDADNATAAAFRSAQTCVLNGGDHASGALVVPLLTPEGCAGVLAIELQHGREQAAPVRAVATILAALLSGYTRPATTVELESPPSGWFLSDLS